MDKIRNQNIRNFFENRDFGVRKFVIFISDLSKDSYYFRNKFNKFVLFSKKLLIFIFSIEEVQHRQLVFWDSFINSFSLSLFLHFKFRKRPGVEALIIPYLEAAIAGPIVAVNNAHATFYILINT